MELGFRELNSRLQELDKRFRQRADSISYPQWFMMPTNEGVRFLLATFLLGVASFNTGNNLIYLIFSLMLSIILLSYALVTVNIRGLRLKVKVSGPVYAAEESEIILRVNNNKSIGSYSVRIRLPSEFGSSGYVPYVVGGGSVSVKVKVRPASRGVLGYGSFIIESSFPFIFFRRRCMVQVEGNLIVYPALMDIELGFSGGYRGQGGFTQRAGEGDELLSLRAFREGDSHKSVHWKASAKSAGLLVKEYSETMPKMSMIVIDGSGPSAPEHFEKAVSYAASAAILLVERGYYVGLIAPGVDLPYGSGRGHMYRLLDQLAQVKEGEMNNEPLGDELKGLVVLVKKAGLNVPSSLVPDPDLTVNAENL
ncbi:DUF58 domain-containing protein [Nitrospirota bacterium]